MRLFRRRPRDERAERLAHQREMVGPNGWTCHVCGDYRPDELIGVFSSVELIGPGIPMQTNVRYCLDRPACAAAAPFHKFVEAGS